MTSSTFPTLLRRAVSSSLVAVPLLAGTAVADDEEHFDVWLQIVDNAIQTGAISEDGDPLDPTERVFGAEFGEDGAFPFTAFEPGFQLDDGSLSPFATMGFNIEDSVTRWTGDGFGTTAETMTLSFGPASVTSGNGLVNGFDFTADDEGGFHGHFDILLNGDGADPMNGVYLLPLSVNADLGGVNATSDTFWFVMNLGEDEMVHDAAMDWVQMNLVPAPAGALLFGLMGFAARRRRG